MIYDLYFGINAAQHVQINDLSLRLKVPSEEKQLSYDD
jgi:hypothetical protein